VAQILSGKWPSGKQPPFWDGSAGIRVVQKVMQWLNSKEIRLSASRC